MKLKKIGKIALLILTLLTTLGLLRTLVNLIFSIGEGYPDISTSILIILTKSILGILTFVYHLSSLKIYTQKTNTLHDTNFISIPNYYWVSAIAFGSVLILFIGIEFLQLILYFGISNNWHFLRFINVFPLILGVITIIEAIKTRRRYKKLLNHNNINLDEIGQS
ncbi:MAG: hypothetical protein COA58_00010 [Bacteroidetes bacterium]|nr:MAG: hypothetical protein COA58_00010 [Bacteroidota bacterium]